ncbi:hypothetical protein B0T18DRAFT_429539 [Schizothecium vesticola]|uniref:Uncharacterized protein n=1 Tax=Schizothecium vesticola TaxID=314040 RepID=A0AA40EW06_9PEZI|nr:hypothetical protein B0T18DRAFT_429539 [Schizothecium vesticola]
MPSDTAPCNDLATTSPGLPSSNPIISPAMIGQPVQSRQPVQPCTPPPRRHSHKFAGLASSPESSPMDGAHEFICSSTDIVVQPREASPELGSSPPYHFIHSTSHVQELGADREIPSTPSVASPVDLDDNPCANCGEDNEPCRGRVADDTALACIKCDQLERECTPAAPLLLSIRTAWRAARIEQDHMYGGNISTASRLIRDTDALASAGIIPA